MLPPYPWKGAQLVQFKDFLPQKSVVLKNPAHPFPGVTNTCPVSTGKHGIHQQELGEGFLKDTKDTFFNRAAML